MNSYFLWMVVIGWFISGLAIGGLGAYGRFFGGRRFSTTDEMEAMVGGVVLVAASLGLGALLWA